MNTIKGKDLFGVATDNYDYDIKIEITKKEDENGVIGLYTPTNFLNKKEDREIIIRYLNRMLGFIKTFEIKK